MNPVKQLDRFGQSIWLDFIRRSLVEGGGLAKLVSEDGLRGVTSNPAIFEKAIGESDEYTDALGQDPAASPIAIYERLAIRDIQGAADVLRPVYDESQGLDGYVSLEVSPFLAQDSEGTIAEARRLWREVARPNVMIKVPGTPEGMPAIERLLGEGMNINVTLLFARSAYEQCAQAYVAGLERFVAGGGDPRWVASVASFFVSRIDTAVDAQLKAKIAAGTKGAKEKSDLEALFGKTAIANARLAYARWKEIFSGPRWQALSDRGARPQRVLWASTGTKDPRYSDVLYIEELIGPQTVNTVPPATLDAFRDHGKPRASLEEGIPAARETLAALARVGISLDDVTRKLVEDGVRLFAEPFSKLLAAIERKTRERALEAAIEDWRTGRKVERLFARDASLWTGKDEAQWLGWLDLPEEGLAHAAELEAFADEVRAKGHAHALVLGMGGSSLAPDLFARTFGRAPGRPELLVLDSTDPAQIRAFERRIDLAKTLFIVSSKSGSTTEPNILKDYFFEKVKAALGAKEAGARFVAVTDPGSKLNEVAKKDGFWRIFPGVPSVGGRYSALSNFGLVPAAVAGVNVRALLESASAMSRTTRNAPPEANPAVRLGLAIGTLARRGRDKLTLAPTREIASFGAWLEQLVAESTGKNGKGIVPIDREPLGAPEVYGTDRVFVYLELESAKDHGEGAALAALEKAGHPVLRVAVPDLAALGGEFFRFEIATAVAGAVIGINPFDQPDVEASKIATRKLTDEVERTGALPAETPLVEDAGLRPFADARNAERLAQFAHGERTARALIRAHLARVRPGTYFALLAYLEMSAEHEEPLAAMRLKVRDGRRVATCLEFGPRFLHSTGQAYKGGPPSGVFLQITCDDAEDLPVPGKKYTFGTVKAAQARGDFAVLAERGRRALRVHLGKDVRAGLATLRKLVEEGLQ